MLLFMLSINLLHFCIPILLTILRIAITLYTSPLEDIIDAHKIHKMFYADDTQLYISFKRTDNVNVTLQISECVQSIKEWSQVNGLKLNDTKTEFLHLSSRHIGQAT